MLKIFKHFYHFFTKNKAQLSKYPLLVCAGSICKEDTDKMLAAIKEKNDKFDNKL